MSIDTKIIYRLDHLDEESKLKILNMADSILEQKGLPPVRDILGMQEIKEGLEQVCKVYPIKSIGVFGSYARGEADEESDIDLVVEFKEKIGLMKVLGLKTKLETYFCRNVDLIEMDQVDEEVKKAIRDNVVIVYERE